MTSLRTHRARSGVYVLQYPNCEGSRSTSQANQPLAQRRQLITFRQVGSISELAVLKLLPQLIGHIRGDARTHEEAMR